MNVGRSARPIAKRMHRALQALDAASSPQTERSQQSVQVLRDERDERLARNSCKAAAFNSQGGGAPTPAGRPWKTCPNNPFQALKGETKSAPPTIGRHALAAGRDLMARLADEFASRPKSGIHGTFGKLSCINVRRCESA